MAEDVIYSFLILKTLLEDRFEVIHAENGAQAVDLFKKVNPVLIFMDIKMPIMDGIEASRHRPRAENQQDLFHGVPFLLRAGCLCSSEDPALGLKDLGVLPSDLHAVAHGQCADILAGGINAPAL